MKENTKERLKVCLIEDEVAAEVSKRIEMVLAEEPSSKEDAEDLLAQLNPALNEKIITNFANGLAGDKAGAAGKWVANKVNGIVAVLQGKIDSEEGDPGENAQFSGQVAGMTTDVVVQADEPGVAGNISLTFNGVETISELINTHNGLGGVQVSLISGDGDQVPEEDESVALTGGVDPVPGDETALDEAKAAMGDDSMSADTKDALDHGLAAEEAGDDFMAQLAEATNIIQDL